MFKIYSHFLSSDVYKLFFLFWLTTNSLKLNLNNSRKDFQYLIETDSLLPKGHVVLEKYFSLY